MGGWPAYPKALGGEHITTASSPTCSWRMASSIPDGTCIAPAVNVSGPRESQYCQQMRGNASE
jgi:hypothetical protein